MRCPVCIIARSPHELESKCNENHAFLSPSLFLEFSARESSLHGRDLGLSAPCLRRAGRTPIATDKNFSMILANSLLSLLVTSWSVMEKIVKEATAHTGFLALA